jgi:hypothetical protein
MVRPQELVESVLYTLQQSERLPDSTNFVGYEPDPESQAIKLPVVEVSTGVQATVSESNTDFIGFKTDSDGNQVGRLYETLYTQTLNISVWTAHESKYSPRDISDSIRDELYNHATAGPAKPLRKPDGSTLDEVWRVAIQDGEQTDELGRSPTLRRWQQDVIIQASEQYVTDEADPIEAFDLDADAE